MKNRQTNNQRKSQDCNLSEVMQKVISKGIGLDSNPMDLFIGIIEELNLVLTKKEIEDIHECRNYLEDI